MENLFLLLHLHLISSGLGIFTVISVVSWLAMFLSQSSFLLFFFFFCSVSLVCSVLLLCLGNIMVCWIRLSDPDLQWAQTYCYGGILSLCLALFTPKLFFFLTHCLLKDIWETQFLAEAQSASFCSIVPERKWKLAWVSADSSWFAESFELKWLPVFFHRGQKIVILSVGHISRLQGTLLLPLVLGLFKKVNICFRLW